MVIVYGKCHSRPAYLCGWTDLAATEQNEALWCDFQAIGILKVPTMGCTYKERQWAGSRVQIETNSLWPGSWHLLQNKKWGWVRKFQIVKWENPENPFYSCWCWAWQLPLSKNELLVAAGQDADTSTCQRQTAEVTAVLVKWAWRQTFGASGALMTISRLLGSAGSLLELGSCAFPTPLGWVSGLIRNAGGISRWSATLSCL